MSEISNKIGQPINMTIEAMKEVGAEKAVQKAAQADESATNLQAEAAEDGGSLIAALKKQDVNLKKNASRIEKGKKATATGTVVLNLRELSDKAKEFLGRNPRHADEMDEKKLIALRQKIEPGDDKDTILAKLMDKSQFPDVSVAFLVLDYLLATSDGDLKANVQAAKDELQETRGREIRAGLNIKEAAKQAASKELGDVTTIRDVYRDVVADEKIDALSLYQKLKVKYPNPTHLTSIKEFLVHTLGMESKMEGSSIEPAKLIALMKTTRKIQAFISLENLAEKEMMPLIEKEFIRQKINQPPQLTKDNFTATFAELASQRHYSPEKILSTAAQLGIS